MSREKLNAAYLADESAVVKTLIAQASWGAGQGEKVQATAAGWVRNVRALADQQSPLDALLQQYDLATQEGVLLMCVAEALLRIPDEDTAEKLIADKLADADWESHLGKSESLFVNASTWGLMLSGRMIRPTAGTDLRAAMNRLVTRSGEPVIRLAIRHAMKMMGGQFVMGRTIREALARAGKDAGRDDRQSFDMLGEAALTSADAERYFEAYGAAIEAVGKHDKFNEAATGNSISVKLSALHPRYHYAQAGRVSAQLPARVLELARKARSHNIGLTIDAEEADRLELCLDIFQAVYCDKSLSGWDGLGIAVQAYQKRALAEIDCLIELAASRRRRIPVRLVKGAYWDTEIKLAQELGLPGYPLFTRKCATDVSYLACARRMLHSRDALVPQFATHNAHTIAAVLEFSGGERPPEFQRLHGMGAALYEVVRKDYPDLPVRIYAPVGSHEDLLPYLVRRLLENGANTSFVNRIFDEAVSEESIVADPVAQMIATHPVANPKIPLPANLFRERPNSTGLNLADRTVRDELEKAVCPGAQAPLTAQPMVAGKGADGPARPVTDPASTDRSIGNWVSADARLAAESVAVADQAFAAWSVRPADERARIMERAAELLEERSEQFFYWLVREAGKTLPDAVAELREAVDFCRYYAVQIRQLAQRQSLPGPTGEDNSLSLHGRGVFTCISPWNFPLAIFTGQVAAALVAGNAVIAKPAEQTNIVAMLAVRALHDAGVPAEALQLVTGLGEEVGESLIADSRVAGVAFTGSVEVAKLINRQLAARDGAIPVLIAETGGLNAMIVDSSALPEQVVKDVLLSAFGSAGQRCSALRVLFVQEDIAEHLLKMLAGAMAELRLGDPGLLATDIGPVIDSEAQQGLQAHIDKMKQSSKLIAQTPLAAHTGRFIAPCAFELDSLEQLPGEVFGPVLHVIRYRAADLDKVCDAINARGFGLTVGVQSRIESTWRQVQRRVRAGNCYVNRSMIGAVVGVQPFGGEGLSGTGPKAGGPHYLLRFMNERALSVNTAAIGGNASLLAMND